MSELKSIERLWKEHLSQPFPPALAGKEYGGEDLVLLEADIAGCVTTFLGGSQAPALDAARLRILSECAASLARICPMLPDEHRAYFDRLRMLSEQVLRMCRRNG